MKLSIVSKDSNASHVSAVVKAAKRRGLACEVINFEDPQDFASQADKLGEAVFWRASSIDIKSERASLEPWLSGKLVINKSLFTRVYVAHKYYQQAIFKSVKIEGIPTLRYKSKIALEKAITNDDLRFPFIAKPNLGAHGISVELIKSTEDLVKLASYKDMVFQPFIKNDGDWRVIMLGGRALGVMHRQSKPGGHLNNIFQGGVATKVQDSTTKEMVVDLATKAAAALDLNFCGVDVIYDQEENKYRLLEVNTAPEWLGGFQPTCGIDVATELVDYILEIAKRGSKPLPDLVRSYYNKSLDTEGLSADEIFHFTSRLHLWNADKKTHKQVATIRNSYLGKDDSESLAKLTSYLAKEYDESVIPTRRKYFFKYPKLRAYNKLLFKVLFAETVYNQNLREVVARLKLDEDFIKVYMDITKDRQALQALSTHAINFIFLLNYYLGANKEELKIRGLGYEEFLLQEAEEVVKKLAQPSFDPKELKLDLYLICHVLIAQSHFYARAVKSARALKLIKSLEQAISASYFEISLDIKLEFLVCASLCGYRPGLRKLILLEAENSVSEIGNFLVDKYNLTATTRRMKDRLWQSEHRSVLYLMAMVPYRRLPNITRN